jgi:hypothetical protein
MECYLIIIVRKYIYYLMFETFFNNIYEVSLKFIE